MDFVDGRGGIGWPINASRSENKEASTNFSRVPQMKFPHLPILLTSLPKEFAANFAPEWFDAAVAPTEWI